LVCDHTADRVLHPSPTRRSSDRPVEIPTRYFFAPHGSALSAGSKPLDDLVAYSAERVRGGGCGLVVVALAIHERGRTRQPSPHPDRKSTRLNSSHVRNSYAVFCL